MFPMLVRSQSQTKAIISFPLLRRMLCGYSHTVVTTLITTIGSHVAPSLFQSSLAIATKVFDVL